MPLWRIFSHKDTFSTEQRQNIASDVTALYVNVGLPAFYVNVIFIDVEETGIWIGGEMRKSFVRIAIEQIARKMDDEDLRRDWMKMINEMLVPYFRDRPELTWEYHIYETPRDLWRVQGLIPPPALSDAEIEWKETNQAAPYEGMDDEKNL